MTQARCLPAAALVSALMLSLSCTLLSPSPTPTPTATASATPTPSPTRTPTPTHAPTSTGRPSADWPSTRTLPDGSTLLTDTLIGYSLVLPPGWIALNPGAEETQAILEAGVELNPDLRWMLEGFGEEIAQGTRFIAFDSVLSSTGDPAMATINMVAMDDFRIPLALLLETMASALESMVPGAQVLSQELIPDLNGQPAGRIEMLMDLTTLEGESLTGHITVLLMLSGGKLLELTLQSDLDLYTAYQQEFEQVIQSLTIQ